MSSVSAATARLVPEAADDGRADPDRSRARFVRRDCASSVSSSEAVPQESVPLWSRNSSPDPDAPPRLARPASMRSRFRAACAPPPAPTADEAARLLRATLEKTSIVTMLTFTRALLLFDNLKNVSARACQRRAARNQGSARRRGTCQ